MEDCLEINERWVSDEYIKNKYKYNKFHLIIIKNIQ